MNLIQKQWKSQSEFSHLTTIDIRKVKTLDDSMFIKEGEGNVVRTYFNNVVLRDIFSKVNLSHSSESVISETERIREFQKFLLFGPVMTDEQYNYVQEKRKHFNEWK